MTVAEQGNAEGKGVKLPVEYCPKCGTEMQEMLRTEEGRYVYAWFECPDANCLWKSLRQYAWA